MPDGLDCGNHARVHAQEDEDDDKDGSSGDVDAATRNETDLRRARQRARAVMGEIQNDVVQYLEEQNVKQFGRGTRREQRINEAISRLAATKLSNELVQWLEQRRQQTMGRAVRAAMDRLQATLGDQFKKIAADFTAAEQHLNRVITEVDAGLLYENNDSLANEIGNDITRQIRLGLAQNEPIRAADPDAMDLRRRVSMVLNDGDDPKRQEAGVTGQTAKTKAELISHDSVQQAYTNAATRRYLNNGFRYVIYDAVCDFVTSDLCRRLGECDGPPVLIDLTKTPWLVPPNHPWCRSGVRPTLNKGGEEPVEQEDIADGYLQTIFSTEQFRPTVMDVDRELNRTALQRISEGEPGGEA